MQHYLRDAAVCVVAGSIMLATTRRVWRGVREKAQTRSDLAGAAYLAEGAVWLIGTAALAFVYGSVAPVEYAPVVALCYLMDSWPRKRWSMMTPVDRRVLAACAALLASIVGSVLQLYVRVSALSDGRTDHFVAARTGAVVLVTSVCAALVLGWVLHRSLREPAVLQSGPLPGARVGMPEGQDATRLNSLLSARPTLLLGHTIRGILGTRVVRHTKLGSQRPASSFGRADAAAMLIQIVLLTLIAGAVATSWRGSDRFVGTAGALLLLFARSSGQFRSWPTVVPTVAERF